MRRMVSGFGGGWIRGIFGHLFDGDIDFFAYSPIALEASSCDRNRAGNRPANASS